MFRPKVLGLRCRLSGPRGPPNWLWRHGDTEPPFVTGMSSNGATSSLDYANLAAAAFANRTCSHSGGRSVSAAPRCCAGTDPPIRLYPHSGVERAFSGGSQQGHLRRKISDYSVLLSMVRICGAWQFGGAFAGLFPRPPMAGPPPSLPPYGSGLGRARRRWFPLRPRSPVSNFT